MYVQDELVNVEEDANDDANVEFVAGKPAAALECNGNPVFDLFHYMQSKIPYVHVWIYIDMHQKALSASCCCCC